MKGCYQLQMVIPKRSRLAPVRLERVVRPRRIIITYTDPFDDTMLAKSEMPYEPRRAATGFYSRYVSKCKQALKQIQSHILQGRDPKVTIEQVA